MPQTGRTRALLPHQIVFAVATAAIGGIIAVLGELRDDLGVTNTAIGLIVSAGFFASFVSQIVLAPLADRGHGRRMAAAGLVLSSASLLAMVVADTVVLWVLARSGLGFAAGLLLPGLRRAAAVLEPERAGENLGRLVVAEVSGFILGPTIAAIFVEIGGVRTPFLAFALALALFVPFALRLPDDQGEQTTRTRNSLELLGSRQLQGALVLIFGYFVIIGAFESVIPVMFQDRGGGALSVGIAFTLLGIPIALVSTHAGRLSDRVGGARIAITGMAISAAATLLYGILPGIVPLIAAMTVVGFADGYGFTAGQIAVSQAVPEARQAAALGLMGAAEVLGAGVAALPAAALYEASGPGLTWAVVAGSSLLLLVIGAWRLFEPGSSATPAVAHSDTSSGAGDDGGSRLGS